MATYDSIDSLRLIIGGHFKEYGHVIKALVGLTAVYIGHRAQVRLAVSQTPSCLTHPEYCSTANWITWCC